MTDKIKVRNENMVRDRRTTALLSTNRDEILAYERKKQERKAQQDRLNTLELQVASLQRQIAQLLER